MRAGVGGSGVGGRWAPPRRLGGSTARRARRSVVGLLAACCLVSGCRDDEVAISPEVVAQSDGPRLVLLIVVDQFAADYFDRFGDLFTGGLRRLLDEGIVYDDARHAHAYPATGPGHATLASGEPPRRHGIIGNGWFERESGEEVYCAENDEEVASPERLLVSTLGDWLKADDPQSLVYAVSSKDRSAILLGGAGADGAFWYDGDHGGMESSSYYFDSLPAWVEAYNAERPMDRYFGTVWLALPVEEGELAERGVVDFDYGPLRPGFPHVLGGAALAPSESFYWGVYGSPWSDRAVLAFAQRLVEEESLGSDASTDLLALSFSALDAVGHTYGPHSREVLDTLLRLDRRLRELFDFVDERIGLDEVVIAFSADHGATAVPEVVALTAAGRSPGRLGAAEIACLQRVERGLVDELGEAPAGRRWLRPGPFVDLETIAAAEVASQTVEQAAALLVEACPAVERVWTRSQLEAGGAGGDPLFELYRNGFHPERSPDLTIQWRPGFMLTRSSATTHTTPYAADVDVPIIFRVPGEAARRLAEPAETIDVAPTLAALAKLEGGQAVTGRALLGSE